MHDLVIRSALPWGTTTRVDVAVDGATITEVAETIRGSGHEEWRVGGRRMLPSLVDPHHHLDKACLASRLGGATDLADARMRFGKLRPHLTREDLQARGAKIVSWAIQHGVGALRTHADVDRIVGLKHVEAALALKASFADRIAIQVVAFQPASVALSDEISWQKLGEALELGCDAAGGTTGSRASDAPELMARIVALAARAGCMVDLHLDETLDPAVQNLGGLARLAIEHGLQDRVVASHCCSLSVAPVGLREEAVALAADARLHVIALPLTNLYLQGRDSGLRGLAPVAQLLAAGVNVACGSDNVQDPFLPAGNADPLLAAQTLGLAAHIADPTYLMESVTARAARAIGVTWHADWCRAGARACFSIAECGAEDDPIACLAPRSLVVFNGRVVRRPGDGGHGLPPMTKKE